MDIIKKEEQGVVILAPDGRLDSNSAPILEQEIGQISSDDSGFHLLLDFSRVEYISSAGLRVVQIFCGQQYAGPCSGGIRDFRF